MDKELMIQKLMREIKANFSFDLRLGLIDRTKYNRIIKEEKDLLQKKNYIEIEIMFF